MKIVKATFLPKNYHCVSTPKIEYIAIGNYKEVEDKAVIKFKQDGHDVARYRDIAMAEIEVL